MSAESKDRIAAILWCLFFFGMLVYTTAALRILKNLHDWEVAYGF